MTANRTGVSIARPTLADVARAAGVSVSTASRALSGASGIAPGTVQQVREAASRVGYSLRPSRPEHASSHTVGVLVANIASPFFAALIESIEDAALRKGYNIILHNSAFQQKRQTEGLHLLTQRKLDGLIVVPVETEDPDLPALLESGLPIVQVDRYVDNLRCDVVVTDNARSAYQAMRFLVEQGYQRVGILTGPDSQSAHRDRSKGALDALRDASRPVADRLIKTGSGTRASGYQLISELLDAPERPDAVFTTSLEITTGALLALRDRGVAIPADLGIVAFDEFDFASLLGPPLTTVEQRVDEMGAAAFDLLVRRIQAGAEPYEPVVIQLEGRLIVRSSTRSQESGAPGQARHPDAK